MAAYLRINGRPMCVHTDCMAGMDNASLARVYRCGYSTWDEAEAAASRWETIHPRHGVVIVSGSCPVWLTMQRRANRHATTPAAGLSDHHRPRPRS